MHVHIVNQYGTHLKGLDMLLMLKEESAGPLRDIRHFWREHVLLNQPVAHVVILSAPAPEVDSIAIHLLKLLTGEDGDPAKEVLSCTEEGRLIKVEKTREQSMLLGIIMGAAVCRSSTRQ